MSHINVQKTRLTNIEHSQLLVYFSSACIIPAGTNLSQHDMDSNANDTDLCLRGNDVILAVGQRAKW